MHGEMKNSYKIFVGKLDLGLDGRILLKCIFGNSA
jgi:hypothetical protein